MESSLWSPLLTRWSRTEHFRPNFESRAPRRLIANHGSSSSVVAGFADVQVGHVSERAGKGLGRASGAEGKGYRKGLDSRYSWRNPMKARPPEPKESTG